MRQLQRMDGNEGTTQEVTPKSFWKGIYFK